MSIQSGLYRIRNAKSGTYFDASLQDSGVIHGWASRPDNQNQKWIVEPSGQGVTIKNAETGEYASVHSSHNGTPIQATGNQTEWEIRDQNGGQAIYVAGTQSVCDLDMGRHENGATINLWHYTGAEQQIWSFERDGDIQGGGGGQQQFVQQPQQQQYQQQPQPQQYQQQPQQPEPAQRGQYIGDVAPGVYCIHNALSGTAADLAGAGTAEGTPITGWEVNRGSNQTWALIPGQNGYLFKNEASGTYLGLQGGGNNEGTRICGSPNPVEWQIVKGDQGYTVRLASNPSVVLDLAGGGTADGVPICLYSNHSGPNQQWKFEAKQ